MERAQQETRSAAGANKNKHRKYVFNFNYLAAGLAPTLVLSVHLGCSPNRANPAFEMGTIIGFVPKKPTISIIDPESGTTIRAKALSKVTCIVDITVPDGGALPQSTGLQVLSKKSRKDGKTSVPRGGGTLIPKSRHGNTYRFTSNVRLPSRAGEYRLVANALYVVDPEKDKNLTHKHAFERFQYIEFSEAGCEIEVHR